MYILIDIGGTKTKIAKSETLDSFDNVQIFSTSKDYDDGIKMIIKKVKLLSQKQKIDSIVIGIPGRLSRDKKRMLGSRNLKNWRDKTIVNDIENSLKTNAFLVNDTDLVGLGEANFGSGKDADSLVYITVSTGVGGAKLIKGRLDLNSEGFEPGYQIIDADKSLCPNCSQPYDLQSYIGGKAIKERTGKYPENIKEKEFWDDIAMYLAIGINNTVMHSNYDKVVLGGSIMKNKIKIESVRKYLKERFTSSKDIPELVLAKLGDEGGLYGGMRYLKSIEE